MSATTQAHGGQATSSGVGMYPNGENKDVRSAADKLAETGKR